MKACCNDAFVVCMNKSSELAGGQQWGGMLQAGFFLKAVVLAVSSFKEVLFLDADNVPVVDPTTLFHSQDFQSTGALFWRDFWDASWAPDAPVVLGVSSEQLPSFTLDSGQMLLDKSRYDFCTITLHTSIRMHMRKELYFPCTHLLRKMSLLLADTAQSRSLRCQ